ncbi:MAG TPA: signal peptidase II [Acidimicrobiales bacterium]|nr:signal peptidase II [Acidimicrobiales bacterium]
MTGPRPAALRSLGVAAAVIGLDQLTKWWAVNRLSRGSIHLVWTLRLSLVHNSGAAFSFFSGKGYGPAIALAAIAVLAVLALSSRQLRGRLGETAIGLVMGGALGNLSDRLFRSHSGFLQGGVVDFVDLQWWPVFNLADTCVVVGVLLIAAAVLLSGAEGPAGPSGSS